MKRLAIGAVVLHLLSPFALGSESGQPTTRARSQWDGVFTIEQAERGRWAYAKHCALCHGNDLEGLPQPVSFPGQSALTPPLVGDAFAENWNGLSLADLVERIRISMPQQNPGSVDRTTVTDIVAFMLQSGQYPAGDAELSPHLDDLTAMLFLTTKR